jgi:hypothetical protein
MNLAVVKVFMPSFRATIYSCRLGGSYRDYSVRLDGFNVQRGYPANYRHFNASFRLILSRK